MGNIVNPYYMEKIKRFRLIDDTFMSKVFEDKKCAELLLNIILNKDLTVTKVVAQCDIKNLQGRSIRLDIYAVDENGIHYNIEVQRNDEGAVPKRARYNSSLIDANISKAGDSYDELPETYVIFITENDVLQGNLPIYTIERTIKELGNRSFNDKSHIIYVNSSIKDDTKLGRLMNDFYCTDAKDITYKVLAERVSYFKNDTKGVNDMCEIMEEVKNDGIQQGIQQGRQEGIQKNKIEMALNMLSEGNLPFELIARVTGLTLEEIKELAEKKTV